MAGTRTPLTILLLPPCNTWTDKIEEWRKAGHAVNTLIDFPGTDVDLILGANCWRMDDAHRKYAELAVKSSQAKKKGKK